ncbi:MAG: signal peptidase I [Candidatus Hinthialibacter antarcticus]|nr:signal peptidase I [Candidatus Hinthialibacter antarcticus]
MMRFYRYVAEKMKNYLWGRQLLNHISRHGWFYANFEALYTSLVIVLLVTAYIVIAYKIPSASMHDTLLEGDRIFVSKFLYQFKDVEVGDIVVFRTKGIEEIYDPAKPYYIKRVVGLSGDELRIQNGLIYRNGKLLDTPEFFLRNYYTPYRSNSRFTVPDGEIFCFGDNSYNSLDSRAWSGVPIENVVGKAFFRFWPLARVGLLNGVPPERARINRDNTPAPIGSAALQSN